MEKHLTLKSDGEPQNRHFFSEEHLAALKGGAKRRKNEQLVGNWIRLTNPALFAQLLHEAQTPPVSPTLQQMDAQTPNDVARRPNPPAGSVRTEGEMPQIRKPLPPQLNIT